MCGPGTRAAIATFGAEASPAGSSCRRWPRPWSSAFRRFGPTTTPRTWRCCTSTRRWVTSRCQGTSTSSSDCPPALCGRTERYMAKTRDYYDVLGVPRTASQKDIGAAFRKLARKHHPDLNAGDKQAELRFKEISEAHEV